ncbi:MAG: penicillin-binding protein 2 [Alphaproteobacteria bacterium]|nr:MAG: penicillin-binding protein 2 [Alphaproteobacteria bacterium]
MSGEQSRFRTFSRRAALLAGAQGLAATILGGRLYYLGVIEADRYETLAEDNRISIRLLAPARGEILDRFGARLATNRRDYRVFLIPEQARDMRGTLERLGRVITLDEGDLARIKRQISRQRAFLPVTVAEGLDWRDFARVNVEALRLPGVLPDAGLTRHYPLGPSVSQVVGYVGAPAADDLDGDPLLGLPGFKVGKRGIERAFDDALRGEAGTRQIEVNAYGRPLRELSRDEGKPGDNILLTLDGALQEAIASRLGEESAAVVVMDVVSGDIYAQVSTPSYDPNSFTRGISRENWQALLRDPRKPLLDKSLNGQYPPGSTVKMVVALAALHEGVISSDTTVHCTGEYRLGDNLWHCWKKGGHGRIALVDAIAQSCDVYFYRAAQELGIERLAAWAHRFGLGETYGIEIGGESAGLVPTPGWKLATSGRPWVGGETLNVGIGQGALLATPLQLAVMTARIANGGRQVVPHLVRQVGARPRPAPADWPDLGLARGHLAAIHRGMEKVLEYRGTAHASRLEVDGMRMAGKTGTAQVRRITKAQRDQEVEQSDLPWRERHHAWFVAYAPSNRPRYALSVLIEHGGGGSSAAAPVAHDVMEMVLRRDPARRPVAGSDRVADRGDGSTGGAR